MKQADGILITIVDLTARKEVFQIAIGETPTGLVVKVNDEQKVFDAQTHRVLMQPIERIREAN